VSCSYSASADLEPLLPALRLSSKRRVSDGDSSSDGGNKTTAKAIDNGTNYSKSQKALKVLSLPPSCWMDMFLADASGFSWVILNANLAMGKASYILQTRVGKPGKVRRRLSVSMITR
jgi:hypothetical protein